VEIRATGDEEMTPDHSDITDIEKRMKGASKRMREMSSEVGMADTILRYDSDRRSGLLARYASVHLKAGESATAAETLARADGSHDKELQLLMSQYQDARVKVREFECERITWETSRSLLARQRETLRTLPETEA
jgi:hypothetical protein